MSKYISFSFFFFFVLVSPVFASEVYDVNQSPYLTTVLRVNTNDLLRGGYSTTTYPNLWVEMRSSSTTNNTSWGTNLLRDPSGSNFLVMYNGSTGLYNNSRKTTYGTGIYPFRAYPTSAGPRTLDLSETSPFDLIYGYVNGATYEVTVCPYNGVKFATSSTDLSGWVMNLYDCPINPRIQLTNVATSSPGTTEPIPTTTYEYIFQHNESNSVESQKSDIIQIIIVLVSWVAVGVFTFKGTKKLFS